MVMDGFGLYWMYFLITRKRGYQWRWYSVSAFPQWLVNPDDRPLCPDMRTWSRPAVMGNSRDANVGADAPICHNESLHLNFRNSVSRIKRKVLPFFTLMLIVTIRRS